MLAEKRPAAEIARLTGVSEDGIARIAKGSAPRLLTYAERCAKWKEYLPRAKELWREGIPASEIARRFRADGLDVTNNAVIGQLFRAGARLSPVARKLRLGKSGRRRGKLNAKKPADARVTRHDVVAQILDTEPLPVMADPDIPLDRRTLITDLEGHSCRWPYGEPGAFHFCGARKVAGLPYCAQHARRAYAVQAPRGRPTKATKEPPIPTFADSEETV